MSSNPTSPVSIFNANTTTVLVQVNDGPQISVTGASGTNLTPGLNSTGASFYTNGAAGTSGVFGVGNNSVLITPSGSNTPVPFTINLSGSFQIISLQLYLFWASATTAGWALLNNGQVIAMDATASLGGGSSSPSMAAARRR